MGLHVPNSQGHAPLPAESDIDQNQNQNQHQNRRTLLSSMTRPMPVSTPSPTATSPETTTDSKTIGARQQIARGSVLTPDSLADEQKGVAGTCTEWRMSSELEDIAESAFSGVADGAGRAERAAGQWLSATSATDSVPPQPPQPLIMASPAPSTALSDSISHSPSASHSHSQLHSMPTSHPTASSPEKLSTQQTTPAASTTTPDHSTGSESRPNFVSHASASPQAPIPNLVAKSGIGGGHLHKYENHSYINPVKPQQHGHSASVSMTTTAAPNTAHATIDSPSPGLGHDATIRTTTTSSPSSQTEEFPPLHMSSVLPGTLIAQPKPIALPSTTASTPLPTQDQPGSPKSHQHNHQLPDRTIRNSAFSGNVAQLEATAERLSTGTSSIGDAIRDLHGELKRSDSRRSSKLAASLRAQGEDPSADGPPLGQLKRHLSNASSIVATNIAARHGGYSPGGFVLSPNHSLTGRLRSGSRDSQGRPDFDNKTILSRHGPGKASVRSVRSTKLSLAEISESEPTTLTRAALDAADIAPPIEHDEDDHDVTIRPDEHNDDDEFLRSNSFQKMLDQALRPDQDDWEGQHQHSRQEYDEKYDEKPPRPSSAQSNNTFQQAIDAFADFDGVFYEPDQDWTKEQRHAHFDHSNPLSTHAGVPTRYSPPPEMEHPQSYMDPSSGQQMLYYPARVPAMLNLPPKLSNKPKADQRQNRRSQVLSTMMEGNKATDTNETKRKSAMPEVSKRDSFLPDPLAGHRGSFIALSQDGMYGAEEEQLPPRQDPEAQPELEQDTPAEHTQLRRPKRLSQIPNVAYEGHKSKPSVSNLPPQLRASAFFDLPAPAAPAVETKEGSAMATLDSMLDASTNAPVSAFTNNSFAAVGDEVYGKEKKKKKKDHKPKASSSSLQPEAAKAPVKKRSSRSWFKRSTSYNSEDKSEAKDTRSRSPSAVGDASRNGDDAETQALTSSVDGKSVKDNDEDPEGSEEEGTDSDEEIAGQPTTLLAELQLRKQKAKQRTQPRVYGQAAHMTLLEMDAVAETERKNRKNKRVNLAWEDPNAHEDQNGSDDEDVPLAIIAAKHQGAKNMADLDRPIGLMERREIEDNEPLSQRKSRLMGAPASIMLPKRQSMATLSAHLGGNVRTPTSIPISPARTPEPEEPEIEEETLGARKKRLEAKELPKARPVSSSFSAELLSQFGDRDEAKSSQPEERNKENLTPSPNAREQEDETLGQRRRRLQAEREAREREMSYGNLVGSQSTPVVNRRLSMADMLAAHPKKDTDTRAQRERARIEQEYYAAKDQEAKMAAMRQQLPTTLSTPGINRSGGFHGGLYNDGIGGLGAQSTGALNTHGLAPMQMHNRSTTALSGYGMPMQQPGYAQSNFGAMNQMSAMNNMNAMGGYNAMQHGNPYAGSSMQLPLQMEMPQQVNTASMKRIDQWRHGVMP